MASSRLFIGINGGHGKSTAFAVSDDFSQLKVVCGQSLNLHTFPFEQVVIRLEDLVARLARRLDLHVDEMKERTARLVLSMPGAGTQADQELVNVCLSIGDWRQPGTTLAVDDTWAGLVAGTLSYTGTCAFGGTGASVYVHVDNGENCGQKFGFGKPFKIDGWGPTIGDFGSGFQLVTDMFRMFNRCLDKGRHSELLFDVLRLDPLIKDIRNAQRWFDGLYIVHPREWRIKFAQLAAAITSAADAPRFDPDAKTLVEAAAGAMIESINIALERFPKARELPVVFQGGMFEHSRLYLDLVTKATEEMTSGPVYLSLFRPVVGAEIIALSNPASPPDKASIRDLYTRIRALGKDEQVLLIREHGRDLFTSGGP